MADKPDKEEIKDEITEFVWIILALFLSFYFLSLVVSSISSSRLLSLGWKALTPEGILIAKTKPISSLINPINSRFAVIKKEAMLYSSPGGKVIATLKLNDGGTILGGPVIVKGEKYWRVSLSSGETGWIKEEDIAAVPQSRTPLKELPTLISTQVETSKDTVVFSEPGVNQIKSILQGSLGSIIEGPIIKDGIKYWNIRFDDGTVGWVDENSLISIKTERQSISKTDDIIGAKVSISSGPADVFDLPGGNSTGRKFVGVTGVVSDGPRVFSEKNYWKVKFDDGSEGWVEEGNLDYLRITKTPLYLAPSYIGGRVSANRNSVPVYDRAGGNVILTKSKDSIGKIIEGPIVFENKKYWHIEFDDGKEGWVSEDDLDYLEDTNPNFLVKTISFFVALAGYLKYLIILIAILLIGFVVYLYRQLSYLRIKEREALYPQGLDLSAEDSRFVNPSWERVLDYIDSFNESDWKLSIIEADIMLGELLDKLSLPGETIGEKLKLIEKSDFTTVDNAWEAHKIRNQISHEGDFRLSQREARRVIDLYRTIFDEFEMI
jgi:hypothetical protein